ncbi:hypothetical protein JTB14_030169 [Gonioctena quinquepunctata]|nr:hypothetical protein JTB14_030169 [Gonioctena quinquepunctata]
MATKVKSLTRYGYAGKECLLRTICEAAEYSTKNTGVLGDILHVLLTPSSSRKQENFLDYENAEQFGNKKKCESYRQKCPLSVLDAFSRISTIFEAFT